MSVDNSKSEARQLCAKKVECIGLMALLPNIKDIFNRLPLSGSPACALFGGAFRGLDLSDGWGESIAIKDYDLRAGMPSDKMIDGWCSRWASELFCAFGGVEVEVVPSLGTARLRNVVKLEGIEFDIGARLCPGQSMGSLDCSIARALDSHAGLCFIALPSDMQAVRQARYLADAKDGIVSLYHPSDDSEKSMAYAKRLAA